MGGSDKHPHWMVLTPLQRCSQHIPHPQLTAETVQSIQPIDRTLTSTSTLGQSGSGNILFLKQFHIQQYIFCFLGMRGGVLTSLKIIGNRIKSLKNIKIFLFLDIYWEKIEVLLFYSAYRQAAITHQSSLGVENMYLLNFITTGRMWCKVSF